MDLFYRGYDPAAPITSAAEHLGAAAARMALSMVDSMALLPEAAWAEFKRLLAVEHLWALCLVLGGWLIATLIGGVVGAAVNAVLIGYGLKDLWERLSIMGAALRKWAEAFYHAQREAELQVAGQYFAEALSVGGLGVLELVVTHKAFRLAEAPLLKRFPVPEWLRRRYAEAIQQRERTQATKEPPKAEGKKPQAPLSDRIHRLGAQVPALPLAGARRIANEFPALPLAVGILSSVAAGGTLWLVLHSATRRPR